MQIQIRTLKSSISACCAIALLLTSFPLAAKRPQGTTQHFPLSTFEAQYSVHWHGIKAGNAIIRLKEKKDGMFAAESHTVPTFSWIPLHFVERSEFKWHEGKIKPVTYFYNLKEARKHKIGHVNFDYKNLQVTNKDGQEPWQQDMPENIQDKITHTLLLRMRLQKGDDNLSFIVAEDDEIKPYEFKIINQERISTSLGAQNTVKVQHLSHTNKTTLMWLAPDLEYLPVKVHQIKDNKVFAKGEINNFKRLK